MEEGKLTAPLCEGTTGAFGVTGSAGVAAVEDEPVVGDGPEGRLNVALKVLLHRKGRGTVGKAQSVGHSKHVSINGNHRFVIHYGSNDVGGFSANTGKAHKRVYV